MDYENFLFSQLFMNYVENNQTMYTELEYDVIYPEVLRHKELFLHSTYNVDEESEYDCIVKYLSEQVI